MQSIKRITLLLKPVIVARYSPVILRLQETGFGVSLSLKALNLKNEDFSLYLYGENSRLIPAGALDGGCLFTTLGDISLPNIKAGALFHDEDLIFKSDNIDRFSAQQLVKSHLQQNKKKLVSIEVPKEEEPTMQEQIPYVEQPRTREQIPYVEAVYESTQIEEEPIVEADTPIEPPQRIEDLLASTEGCPKPSEIVPIDPFPGMFKESSWEKLTYQGPGGAWHYIVGNVENDNEQQKAIGVPGKFSPSPPPWLKGFDTHLVSSDGTGYWVMFYSPQ